MSNQLLYVSCHENKEEQMQKKKTIIGIISICLILMMLKYFSCSQENKT